MIAQYKGNGLQNKLLSRNKFVHLTVLARDHLSELSGSSCQKTERLVVHGNSNLYAGQQLCITPPTMNYIVHSIGSLLRTHRIEVSNAQQCHIGGVDIVDQLHVTEYPRITTMVNMMTYI